MAISQNRSVRTSCSRAFVRFWEAVRWVVTDHDFSIFLALARSICRRDPREAFARFTARDLAVSPSTLSYRDVEELLRERGLDLSYETVRRRVLKADRRLDQLIALANEERF